MKKMILSVLFLMLIFSSRAFAEGEAVIADFDKNEAVTNSGQSVEVWLKDDGKDDTQKTVMALAQDDALGKTEGRSLRLEYDVDSPNPAYNGLRVKLGGIDARPYKSLQFYVKGDAKAGFSPQFKIELIATGSKAPSPWLFQGVTDKWQKVTVPLSEFWAIGDGSALDQFTVVFADIVNTPKTGAVYLDQIAFTKE